MRSETDHALLQAYARDGDNDAFTEVVRRHAGAVLASAVRQTSDPQLADEVLQTVFLRLAEKAGGISSDTVVIGWLMKATRYTALDALRQERRREKRIVELDFVAECAALELTESEPTGWEQVAPVLDGALARLWDQDRTALLLRFFSRQSLAEVGMALGVTEEAARKRVARALDRLRVELAKMGVTSAAWSLGDILSWAAPPSTPVVVEKALNPLPTGHAVKHGGRWRSKWRWLMIAPFVASTVIVVFGGYWKWGHRPDATQTQSVADPAYAVAGFPDARAVHDFIRMLQRALRTNDRGIIVRAMKYPLAIHYGDTSVRVIDEAEFRAKYDELITPAIAGALLQAPDRGLFCAPAGVMVGSGYVWIGPQTDNGTPQPRIIAINLP